MISIRRRLLVSIFSVLMLGAAIVVVLTYFNAKEELTDLLDENMQQVAIAIAMQEPDYINVNPENGSVLGEQGDFLIQVWANDGTLQYASHAGVDIPLQHGEGLGLTAFKNEEWRYYLHAGEKNKIQIAQPMRQRREDIMEFTFKFFIPVAVQLPLVLVLAWLMIGKGLKPLDFISQSIGQRDPYNLSSIGLENTPVEILPLVGSLNTLLAKLEESLKHQRQFTADAAHELRTPLTVIKLQLDMLERAHHEDDRIEAQEKLRSGVERCIHLVQNLLTLARQEPEAVHSEMLKVDLSALAQDVYEESLSFAEEKNIRLSYKKGDQYIFVMGEPQGLRTLAENLIHNALLYTPEGGVVDVNLGHDERFTVLSIADNGIGISEEDKDRIFDRFYRVLGTKKSGSGLGLSIVKNIAIRHKAEVSVHDNRKGKGVEFRVSFPSLSS